jgi:hypothetical protein
MLRSRLHLRLRARVCRWRTQGEAGSVLQLKDVVRVKLACPLAADVLRSAQSFRPVSARYPPNQVRARRWCVCVCACACVCVCVLVRVRARACACVRVRVRPQGGGPVPSLSWCW